MPPSSRLERAPVVGLLLVGVLGTGCSTLAFYEDTKVAIAIRLDPKAPEPVELTAAFKESVFAMVPPRVIADQSAPGGKRYDVDSVLADFDVRYGAQAGASAARNEDILYAVVTQGLATGKAAKTLADHARGDVLLAHKIVLEAFVGNLPTSKVGEAATALGVAGPDPQTEDPDAVRARVLRVVAGAGSLDAVKRLEEKVKEKFPDFSTWNAGPSKN